MRIYFHSGTECNHCPSLTIILRQETKYYGDKEEQRDGELVRMMRRVGQRIKKDENAVIKLSYS